MIRLCTLIVLLSTWACQTKEEGSRKGVLTEDYTQYVNVFMGTGGKGHTYPGASMPFGMVQLSPDNGIGGWDEISGYFYENTTIGGFSHTHLSGTGVGDLYDIRVFPFTRPEQVKKIEGQVPFVGSSFSHERESGSPGYYQVRLDDYAIEVELTASERVGFHRYTFPEHAQSSILIDLNYARNWDRTLFAECSLLNDSTVTGYRRSTGWAKDQHVYFVACFSKKPHSIDRIVSKEKEARVGRMELNFSTEEGEEILVKVAISPVSVENAMANMAAEVPHWEFEKTHQRAKAAWNRELAKIAVATKYAEEKHIFYSALYHSMLAPTLYGDVDGSYFGPDLQIHKAEDFQNYSTFSLWDTYRAAHPLYTFMHPERVRDMVKSMLVFHEQFGRLPVWPLAGTETEMMIGYHAATVIAEAYLKGIVTADAERAYAACKAYAMSDVFGLDAYKKYAYIPYEMEEESVSKTLEYAHTDWSIAQFAKHLGKEEDYQYFMKRSGNYKNMYNPETGFMQPRNAEGEWLSPFDPNEYSHHYTESNAWHYLWNFPQDITGAIALTGGEEAFEQKLDKLFTEGPRSHDSLPIFSTGMIGQYVHGNEPSHHFAHLYNYVGAAAKAQKYIRQIQTELYHNSPEGYCGNEDCGQMGAWYVFNALGFYPVNPAELVYAITPPLFEEVLFHLPNGKTLKILAEGVSKENYTIASVSLNGESIKDFLITHEQLMGGGELSFTFQ